MKNKQFWLRLSYWSGAVIDALAALLLTFPSLNAWFSGYDPIATSPAFRAANAPAAALMWGWTLLLLWADRRPLERRGVLGLTIFPVLAWMIAARFLEVLVYQAPLAHHLALFILQFSLVGLFGYSLWANRAGQSASLASSMPGSAAQP